MLEGGIQSIIRVDPEVGSADEHPDYPEMSIFE